MEDQYLIDTSAWVEFFNSTPGLAKETVRDLATRNPEGIASTEPVVMELLAGARALQHARISGAMKRFVQLSVDPHMDFAVATELYRATRRRGKTVRSLIDCLIAAVAIRTGAVVVHKDHDFHELGSVSPDLRLLSCLPA